MTDLSILIPARNVDGDTEIIAVVKLDMAKKGNIPWNKGMKGLMLNDLFVTNNPSKSGNENPNWKGGVSVIGNCLDCGVKLKSYPAKYCLPCSMKHRIRKDNSKTNHYRWAGGKPKCLDCGKEIDYKAKYCSSCAKVGKRNSAWNNGTSFHEYPKEFNNQLKRKVRERDNYTCLLCGITEKETGIAMDVHHIDYNKKNSDINNLVSLCHTCHTKTNFNRTKWMEVFRG